MSSARSFFSVDSGRASAILLIGLLLLAASGTADAAVPKRFRIGAHRVRSADRQGQPNINATLRNEADFVVIGHLSPRDRFYVLSEKSFNVGTAFNCRKGDSKRCTAACQQCINANPTNPDACRSTCRIQFVYGFALGRAAANEKLGTGFAGCAWIATSHLVRLHHSPKTSTQVVKLIPQRFQALAKKCKGQRKYSYSKIASLGTSRCQHCRDKNLTGGDAYCGCSSKTLTCTFPVRGPTRAFGNLATFTAGLNHTTSGDLDPSFPGARGPAVTDIPANYQAEIRYVTASSPRYAMVHLDRLPTRASKWGFIKLDDIWFDDAHDVQGCLQRGILRPKPSSRITPCGNLCRSRSVPQPSVGTRDVGDACTDDGECLQGDFCAADQTCKTCSDDSCAEENPDEPACLEGDPSCDVCVGDECAPPAGTCVAGGTMYGPVPQGGTIGCGGDISGSSPAAHGTVQLVRSPDDPDALEVVVSVQGAAPDQTNGIRLWEAAAQCGDPALADTGEVLETDASGDGEADFTLALPWSPFGTDVLGDGAGSEDVVVVLDDGASAVPSGERYSTNGAVGLCTITQACGTFLSVMAPASSDVNEPGKVRNPQGIGVDADGNVFVADSWFVKKFDAAGNFIKQWGAFVSGNPGGFAFAHGVALDASGNVFVTDGHDGFAPNHRVQKFDNDGNFITMWGGPSGPFGPNPLGVAVDAVNGNVFVADTDQHLIQKFDNDGAFLGAWGGFGTDPGQFNRPFGVAVESSGTVLVTDGNNRVQRFAGDGSFLTMWGSGGSGPGQFNGPTGIAVRADGDILVAEIGNSRIQRFHPDGSFVLTWGSRGSDPGQFISAWGVAVNASGDVFVTEDDSNGNNTRVQKFACPD